MGNIKLNQKSRILMVLWILCLALGFGKLMVYANTPGVEGGGLVSYPTGTPLVTNSSLPTLLIFGHPRCPCSQASVGELERLMAKLQGKVKAYVVFVKPEGATNNWADEDLWKKAQSIPGVQVVLDSDGVEAKRFGAKTSGQTFLYDAGGHLVFQGGITSARGHMGDNKGEDSVLAFLQTGKATIAKTPVFGCSLINPERAAPKGRSI